MTDGNLRFLFAMFQGGGNIPLIMPIVGALTRRGHDVRILAGPGIRGRPLPVSGDFLGRIEAAGAELLPLIEPEVDPYESPPPVRGVAFGWMPTGYQQVLERQVRTSLWSTTWAANVMAELRRSQPDILVCDFCLFGAAAAGEASGVPTAVIVHNAFPPNPGRMRPARNSFERIRQIPQRWMLERIWARDGLPIHNDARRSLGLPPIGPSPFAECDRAAKVLILGYEWFDVPKRQPRPNVRYVGTPVDDGDVGQDAWTSPWPLGDPRPLVLVSMSTLQQGQGPAMRNIIEAVRTMPVRALVTLGPSLQAGDFTAPPNVVFETFVSHSAVLPHADAIVSQCGLSTLAKALKHGVPMVCVPLIADQPDNAARIAGQGAGLWLDADASPEQIRAGLSRVLGEPSFGDAAKRLASQMAGERPEERAADELEALAR